MSIIVLNLLCLVIFYVLFIIISSRVRDKLCHSYFTAKCENSHYAGTLGTWLYFKM